MNHLLISCSCDELCKNIGNVLDMEVAHWWAALPCLWAGHTGLNSVPWPTAQSHCVAEHHVAFQLAALICFCSLPCKGKPDFSLCLAWLQMKSTERPTHGSDFSLLRQKREGWKFWQKSQQALSPFVFNVQNSLQPTSQCQMVTSVWPCMGSEVFLPLVSFFFFPGTALRINYLTICSDTVLFQQQWNVRVCIIRNQNIIVLWRWFWQWDFFLLLLKFHWGECVMLLPFPACGQQCPWGKGKAFGDAWWWSTLPKHCSSWIMRACTGTTYLKVSVKCQFYSETPSASAFYFGCGYWGAAVKYLGLRGAHCITDPSISIFYPRGPCL